MLGGNGVCDEYHVIRHLMNLEAVNTYEGTTVPGGGHTRRVLLATVPPGRSLARRHPRHPRAHPGTSHHWHPGLRPQQAAGTARITGMGTASGTTAAARGCNALRYDRPCATTVARTSPVGDASIDWTRVTDGISCHQSDPYHRLDPTLPMGHVSPTRHSVTNRTRYHRTDPLSLTGLGVTSGTGQPPLCRALPPRSLLASELPCCLCRLCGHSPIKGGKATPRRSLFISIN